VSFLFEGGIAPHVFALLALAAFFAGFVDAIAGGGGLVTLPALLAAGLDPRLALATNKGQAVFGAVSSCASFWRKGAIDKKRAPLAFVLGLVGSFGGAALVLAMRPEPLRPLVVVLLLVAAGIVMVPKSAFAKLGLHEFKNPMAVFAGLALLIGAYDGFFGPGTGSMLIAVHMLVFSDAPTNASGNAKVGNLASNVAAFTLFAARGAIVWKIALVMAVANALGAAVGARVALRVGDKLVRVVVLLVVAALIIKLGIGLLHPAK
jgi:hypothetical protein